MKVPLRIQDGRANGGAKHPPGDAAPERKAESTGGPSYGRHLCFVGRSGVSLASPLLALGVGEKKCGLRSSTPPSKLVICVVRFQGVPQLWRVSRVVQLERKIKGRKDRSPLNHQQKRPGMAEKEGKGYTELQEIDLKARPAPGNQAEGSNERMGERTSLSSHGRGEDGGGQDIKGGRESGEEKKKEEKKKPFNWKRLLALAYPERFMLIAGTIGLVVSSAMTLLVLGMVGSMVRGKNSPKIQHSCDAVSPFPNIQFNPPPLTNNRWIRSTRATRRSPLPSSTTRSSNCYSSLWWGPDSHSCALHSSRSRARGW